jgi:dTDP-4-dehydrorhamnose 3,5-epimerase
MEVIKTKIKDLLIIQPDVFGDKRGFFLETYNKERYKEIGLREEFVQDNLSKSAKGVLRGLHAQKDPYAQGKLVQVITGAVLDVAVDARPNSETYGQWESVVLTEENKKQFYLPPGFLHGFITLEEETIFSYKCTTLYNPEAEICVKWDDKELNIDWQLEKYGIKEPIVSEKDQRGVEFEKINNKN